MVNKVQLEDYLYAWRPTYGVFRIQVHSIKTINGEPTYISSHGHSYQKEDLWYTRKEAVLAKIPKTLSLTDVDDMPAGTTKFRKGDKVYFSDVHKGEILDGLVCIVEEQVSVHCPGTRTLRYVTNNPKRMWNIPIPYEPYATLEEALESLF